MSHLDFFNSLYIPEREREIMFLTCNGPRCSQKTSIRPETYIKNCIEGYIKEILKHKKDISTKLYSSNYEIPRWDYLWFLVNFIDNSTGLRSFGLPTFLDIIVELSGINTQKVDLSCYFQIRLDEQTNQKKFYFNNCIISYDFFCHILKNRIEAPVNPCSYIFFSIICREHSNMLFIDNSKIYIYEPHGYRRIMPEINMFLSDITTLYNQKYDKKLVLANFDISCPMGIQNIAKEFQQGIKGYCLLYSHFWLYLILSCSNLKDVSIESIIGKTELNSFILAKTSGNLRTIIHSFANIVFAKFMDYIGKMNYEKQQQIQKEINKYIDDLIRQKNLQYKLIDTSEPRKIDDIDDLFYDELELEGNRKYDGSPCTNDYDCLSHNCVDGICKEYDYNSKQVGFMRKSVRKSARKSMRKPRKSVRKPRKSARKSMRKPRKSVRKPRKSVRKPRKSVRKSVRKPRKSVRKPRKSTRKPRKSTRKPRKSSRKSTRKPRKSRNSVRKPKKFTRSLISK